MKKWENVMEKVREEIKERSGQDVNACIQCGKCTAGCPVVAALDVLPRQVMLYLQSGMEKEVAESKAPWICASCFACESRCPRDLDLAKVMEAVRAKLLRPRGEIGLSPSDLSEEVLREMPQQALVSCYRKHSS